MSGIQRLSLLACIAITFWTNGAFAQSATATALDDERVRLNLSGFSSNPSCQGPFVQRFRNNSLDFSESLNLGATQVTYSGLAGGTYYFEVTGCVFSHSKPDYEFVISNSVTITGVVIPTPAPPGSVTAAVVQGSGDIDVEWAASVNATSYKISFRTHPIEGWVPGSADNWGNWSAYSTVGNTLSTSYTDQAPSIYQYRVVACSISGCSDPTVSLAVIVAAAQFDAGDEYYMPDAQIRAIWTAPEGCLVLFEQLPEACETQFSNAHALIQYENPNHEKMYSQVFTAKAMGKKIDVWFDDNGDCSSLNSLLTIGKIEIRNLAQRRQEKNND